MISEPVLPIRLAAAPGLLDFDAVYFISCAGWGDFVPYRYGSSPSNAFETVVARNEQYLEGWRSAFAPVSASPLTLLTYTGPVSNDPVTLNFQQHIGASDALRTGSYAKSLTFTLSTTNP